MDSRYYQILRRSTPEDFYNSINDPEDELYNIVWDLFEKVIIEPAEIFDEDFRDRNQFRYSINSRATLEFFPEQEYFSRRIDPNPFDNDSDAAGIHLQFSVLPTMSCLFSVGLQIWGASERQAFKNLWISHRSLLSGLFRRCKPMVGCKIPFPAIDSAGSLEELLDNYVYVRDAENFLSFDYSFAQADESDMAQNFMVTMAMLYHGIRSYCQEKTDSLDDSYRKLKQFYSGHIPDLPAPLPCVSLAIATDAG